MAFIATILVVSTVCLVSGIPVRRDYAVNTGVRDQVILPPSEYSSWHNETRQRRFRIQRNEQTPLNPNCTASDLTSFNSSQCPSGIARDKMNRLEAIKQHVLRTLGDMNKAPSSGSNFMNNPFSGESGSAGVAAATSRTSAFSGKIQTFTPECNSPAQVVDSDTWTQPGPFHVFFNVSSVNAEVANETKGNEQIKVPTTQITPSRRGRAQFQVPIVTTPQPTPAPKKTVNIISAKLKLYKIGQEEVKQGIESPKPSEPCNDTLPVTQSGQTRQTVVQPSRSSPGNSASLLEVVTSEKIFVRVFYYLPSTGKRHYRKKLLESKTLTVKESGWIDFDIQNAVKVWLAGDKTNYGLEIEVENDDNELVDVHKYFANTDCNVSNGNSSNQTLSSAQPAYPSPILEICSLSLPAPTENGGVQSYTLPYSMSSYLRAPRHTEKSEEVVQNETPQTSFTHHRRRHHHGDWRRKNAQISETSDLQSTMQADSPAVEQTTRFTLAENHPLRRILGTAATGPFTNEGRGHRGYIRNHRKSFKKDLGMEESEEEESSERVRNIIIENIMVQPENSPNFS